MIVAGSVLSLLVLIASSILLPDGTIMALASPAPAYILIRLLCIILVITLLVLKYRNVQCPIHLLSAVSVMMSTWSVLSWYVYRIGVLDLLAFLQVSVFLGLFSLGWYDYLLNSSSNKRTTSKLRLGVAYKVANLRLKQDRLTTQAKGKKSAA